MGSFSTTGLAKTTDLGVVVVEVEVVVVVVVEALDMGALVLEDEAPTLVPGVLEEITSIAGAGASVDGVDRGVEVSLGGCDLGRESLAC